jgi:2-haloacid dehalogenase
MDQALLFDVFGTVVDWREGVARGSRAVLEPLGFMLDWRGFADAWRAEYQPSMEVVRSGQRGYVKLDVLHRENLLRILPRFGVTGLEEDAIARLVLAWHRLPAWPDVAEGFGRLRQKFLMAPASNGNTALMVDMARFNDIRWDAILGADAARDYKPNAGVYLASAEAFNLAPGKCWMVAAHSNDLKAAAAAGLRTAHVARPGEHGPGTGETQPAVPVDVVARDFVHLAEIMGA